MGDFMKNYKNTYGIIERLLFINEKLYSNKYPNSSTLAKDLEVSVTTISRDIEFLRDRLKAPIKYCYTNKGYYYFEPFNLLDAFKSTK